MQLKYCVVFVISLLFVFVSCQKTTPPPLPSQNTESNVSLSEAKAVVLKWTELEKKRNFEELYSLFSDNRKNELRRLGVNTSQGYAKLRSESEATWNDFVLESIENLSDSEIRFYGVVTIKELGEDEKSRFTLYLVKDKNGWLIDVIKY